MKSEVLTLPSERLESFTLTEDNEIIVVHRISAWWDPIRSRPATVIKRIYHAKDGIIQLKEEIKGEVIPPEYIPEKIKWKK